MDMMTALAALFSGAGGGMGGMQSFGNVTPGGVSPDLTDKVMGMAADPNLQIAANAGLPPPTISGPANMTAMAGGQAGLMSALSGLAGNFAKQQAAAQGGARPPMGGLPIASVPARPMGQVWPGSSFGGR